MSVEWTKMCYKGVFLLFQYLVDYVSGSLSQLVKTGSTVLRFMLEEVKTELTGFAAELHEHITCFFLGPCFWSLEILLKLNF